MSEIQKPKEYSSRSALERAIAVSMPDQYPEAMAKVFADEMLKNGDAVIIEPDNQEETP